MNNLAHKFENNKARAYSLMGGAMALAPLAAFAQAPDTSGIEAQFDLYKVAVVGLVIAFAVVLWAIRGAGLLRPR
jgi:hypothetical protein